MTDFLDSLNDQDPTQEDLQATIPLMLVELASDNSLLKQELFRQIQEVQQLRIHAALALYLVEKTIGKDKYAEIVGEFNIAVANKLKNPTEGSESTDGQGVS